MAVGAHADDIEICVGGTLLKSMALGYDIIYVMATNNMSGNWNYLQPDGSVKYTKPSARTIEPQRKLEAQAGAQFFGTDAIHLDHPQRHYFDDQGQVVAIGFDAPAPEGIEIHWPNILVAYEHKPSVKRLAEMILSSNPEAILTHGLGMVNIEHYATSLLVTQAYWHAVREGYDGMLLHWHDITQGSFGQAYTQWDVHVDITRQWDRKFQAIGLHACQIPVASRMQLPDWGTACQCQYAEVFNIISPKPLASILGHTPFTTEIIQPTQFQHAGAYASVAVTLPLK